jgi:hypothetical protein
MFASPVVAVELLTGRANLGRHWTVTTLMTEPEPLEFIRKPFSICTRAIIVVLAATMMFVVAMMAGVVFMAALAVFFI